MRGVSRYGLVCCCLIAPATAAMEMDPWADHVVNWDPGLGGAPGYDNPSTALGPPEQFTGEGVDPSVVSPFQPAWTPLEIVSIGAGGHLVVAFEEWIEDDVDNPHGIDLIVFGNAGFIDGAHPLGQVAGLFGADGGEVSLSSDGESWHAVPGCFADDAWPTLAWLDAGPYDSEPGQVPANPLTPMDPNLAWEDHLGMDWDELLDIYGSSAGGVGIDLAELGLSQVRFVRIEVPSTALLAPEIDAIVDVPPVEPSDLDGDGTVDVDDLLHLLTFWGPVEPGTPADLDGNGHVDVTDVLIVLGAWTP
ncbi:MAG: hypothetical protein MK085_07990 [Phycisphaerales bacterium]|nr:hypothetical protein [Phycisphaerales bacterium]